MIISSSEEKNSMDKNTLQLLRVKPVIQVFDQFKEMRQIIRISATLTFTTCYSMS